MTSEEVNKILTNHDEPLSMDERPVDALIVDPLASQALIGLFGAVVVRRMADDAFRNPGDPER